jgi:hypothetical protein
MKITVLIGVISTTNLRNSTKIVKAICEKGHVLSFSPNRKPVIRITLGLGCFGMENTNDIRKVKIQSPENICKAIFFIHLYHFYNTPLFTFQHSHHGSQCT